MVFIRKKEANSILPKSGLKHLVAVTPSNTIYQISMVFMANLHMTSAVGGTLNTATTV